MTTPGARTREWWWSGLAIAAAAGASIALSGWQPGQNNNAIHLAILARLFDEPQFAHDAYVQSLRFYSSGLWMTLAGAIPDDRLLAVLLPLQLMSRATFFAGVLMIAPVLGIEAWRRRMMFLVLVLVASPLDGFAVAGGGGLLIAGFTQSEWANGTVLIALALAARRRFGWAVAVWGATLFLNLFVAIWLAVPLAVQAGLTVRARQMTPGRLAMTTAPGAAAAIACAVPVLINLVANPAFGHAPAFDYIRFLDEYWPEHFLVWRVAPRDYAMLAGLAAAGLAAALQLPTATRRPLVLWILSFAGVWAVGAVLPLLTGSALLLNLHLLRVSGFVVIVATLAVAAFATTLAASPEPADRRFWAPLVVVLLATEPLLVPLVAMVTVARSRWGSANRLAHPLVPGVAVAIVVAVAGVRIGDAAGADARFRHDQHRWLQMAQAVRDHTPAATIVLLPTMNIQPVGPLPSGTADQAALAAGSEVFTTIAHRSVWVTGKQGAAVMWSPDYYPLWRARLLDVLALRDLPSRLGYARGHGIALVVDSCRWSGTVAPVLRAGSLCGFSADTPAR